MSFNFHYNMTPMAANASRALTNGKIAGFLPTVAGTLTVKDGGGTTLIAAVPVTAGVYVQIPGCFTPGDQAIVTLAGGAAGTLFA